jgi:hypothetical protein
VDWRRVLAEIACNPAAAPTARVKAIALLQRASAVKKVARLSKKESDARLAQEACGGSNDWGDDLSSPAGYRRQQ